MRIASWNINGMKARLGYLKHWLEARQPDVVGLQELKMQDDQFPHEALAEIGYHAVVHGQKAWNGVAVLTREKPAELVCRGLPGQEEMGSRLIATRVDGLNFITVYVPNGKNLEHEDYQRKLKWYDDLQRFLVDTFDAGDPLVLCGDFNICPTPLDSHGGEGADGNIFHTTAERDRVTTLLGWGFTDLYRHLHPDEQTFSWWDYRAGAFPRNRGLRIDFLLGTPAVQERVLHVETDRDYRKKKDELSASDHAPVLADLR
ncbi:MAG: exodeoxyribonuclease III [Candidatus Binatia bacterium]|nr:exodeoxyribonuclease III [Candidatus Binatia bacterium]MDG2008928.1 exodeoxyribonuclease III [Candidatus Binatia bacterium]